MNTVSVLAPWHSFSEAAGDFFIGGLAFFILLGLYAWLSGRNRRP